VSVAELIDERLGHRCKNSDVWKWPIGGIIPTPLRPHLRRLVVETDHREKEWPSSACCYSRSCCPSSASLSMD
jgi:hypothetical protein